MSEQPGDDRRDPSATGGDVDEPVHDAPPGPSGASGPVYGRVTRFGSPGTPAATPRAPRPGPPPPWGAWAPGPAPWAPPAPLPPATVGWPGPAPGWPLPARPRPRWRPDQYARWGSRVLGDLVDHAPAYVVLVLQLLAYLPLYAGLLRGDVGAQPRWGLLLAAVALSLGSIGWNVYNRWVCGGRTGQSLGKRLTGTRLVSQVDGRPVGTLNAFLRDLLHVLDGFGWIGYLWPLWDEERQTFADKIIETVVVRVADEQPAGWA